MWYGWRTDEEMEILLSDPGGLGILIKICVWCGAWSPTSSRSDLVCWISFCQTDADRVHMDVRDMTRRNGAECFTIFGVLRIRKWNGMNLIRLQA